jgi:hypothetical protein
MIEQAILQWAALADEAERGASIGLIHPIVAKAQADCYRRTVKALEIERDTGIAVCSCCHKPIDKEKPYWMRGGSSNANP